MNSAESLNTIHVLVGLDTEAGETRIPGLQPFFITKRDLVLLVAPAEVPYRTAHVTPPMYHGKARLLFFNLTFEKPPGEGCWEVIEQNVNKRQQKSNNKQECSSKVVYPSYNIEIARSCK